jgi:hypothetical protein
MAFVSFSLSVFVNVIPVSASALLYIINFANCYKNAPPPQKKIENNFLVSILGKLLVFLINYAHYATLFYYEKALGVSERQSNPTTGLDRT